MPSSLSRDTYIEYLSLVFICALLYVGSFWIQANHLTAFDYLPKASLFFLPAGVRLIAFVVARSAGLVGISLGAILTMTMDTSWHPPHWHDYISIIFFSCVIPYYGSTFLAKKMGLDHDLKRIRLWQVGAMALTVSILNGVSMNAYLLIEKVIPLDDAFKVGTLATTFGDMTGIAFTLLLISMLPEINRVFRRVGVL